MEIDESALTGESQPAGKQAALLVAADVPLGNRLNMADMNILLTRGRAELIVTATGAQTEMGRLSQELATIKEVPTPLQIQLDRLGRYLGVIALTLIGLLSFLEYLRGAERVQIILDGVALSVAAIPEGLPVVVTVTLALGMHTHRSQACRNRSPRSKFCGSPSLSSNQAFELSKASSFWARCRSPGSAASPALLPWTARPIESLGGFASSNRINRGRPGPSRRHRKIVSPK